ncbi:lipoate--protein ligase family protein [Parapusillimonas sp. SGNA-6]|nr:lipoate--protein ligase family protein [Parapusillimonas sp. SGNA-6]
MRFILFDPAPEMGSGRAEPDDAAADIAPGSETRCMAPSADSSVTGRTLYNARFDEALIDLAAEQGPCAAVWQAPQGLVVPRTYQSHEGFDAACLDFASQGWPVTVRQSGGGIVPQGPGILNASLAYAMEGKPLDHSDAAYALLCHIIGAAAARYGVISHPQAVEGSFCDGRYNLAVGAGPQARKVAGTAQVWRRRKLTNAATPVQVVLVHALILAAVDVELVTAQANRFEAATHSDRRYSAERVASLHALAGVHPAQVPAFVDDLAASLRTEIQRAKPPAT